ncbi:hypothetical protein ACWDRB_65715 [Nonomuraea sp. NPDC003707]
MRHTEGELRRLLTKHAQEQTGGEPPAHLDAIVRRARHMRRTRRALMGVTAVAFVVVVAELNGLLAGPPWAGNAMIAQHPADSAHVERGPKLPEKLSAQGGERFDLALIHSRHFQTTGVVRTMTFSPTTLTTSYTVVCDDPKAWFVTAPLPESGKLGGTAGPCKPSVRVTYDRLSVPSDWLKRPQSLQVWVFPSNAPIREVAKTVMGCSPPSQAKRCDKTSESQALMRPEVRERLLAEVGEQPGRWAVGVYDRLQ